MEIVLQWLDELDDLVFAGLFKWSLLRSLCLTAALGSAIAVPALLEIGIATDVARTLLNTSLAFLVAWALIGSVSASIARRGRPPTRNA